MVLKISRFLLCTFFLFLNFSVVVSQIDTAIKQINLLEVSIVDEKWNLSGIGNDYWLLDSIK